MASLVSLAHNHLVDPTARLFYSILSVLVEEGVLSEKNAANKKSPRNQSEIVRALMNEGIPALALAKAIGKWLSKPVWEIGIPATLRGDGWLLAGDTVYVMNPFGEVIEQLTRRKQQHIANNPLHFSGFGVLSGDAFEHPALMTVPYDPLFVVGPAPEALQKPSDSAGVSTKEAGAQLCQYIMATAIQHNSSDIHLDPRALGGGTYRFRIDGQLLTMGTIESSEQYESLVNVFLTKTQALNPGEFTEPRDGSFKWPLANREISIRLSLIPVTLGTGQVLPKLTLRLLGLEVTLLKLETLDMTPKQYEIYKRVSRRTQGLVLVTGPTGSGKSTTLFANMREAYDNNPNRSYYTVEDPVEVVVPNFYQLEINVKAGVTFPNALRSLLRADPDVILVGEIRDIETARLAIQASLTGHLVFSTLHTNGAIETISRLLDLGIDPRLLADSLIAVSAQRMVRKVCTQCAEKMSFGETPHYQTYHSMTVWGEGGKLIPALEPGDPIYVMRSKHRCSTCQGQGYKGRHMVAEIFTRDSEIQRLITNKNSVTDILEHLRNHQRYEILWQHGLRLVKQGITTISELESHLDPIGWGEFT